MIQRQLRLILLFALLLPFAAAADTAKVVALEGTAQIRGGGTLTVGQVIPWGSKVVVADGATISIAAANNFAARAWGPSEVHVRQTKKSQSTWLNLLYGRVIAAFKSGRPAALGTPTAVAGVRGTVVYAEDRPGLLDYHCTCEGTVDHTHKGTKQTKTVKSTHHDLALVADANGLQPSTMQNHSDDDVDAVKALLENAR